MFIIEFLKKYEGLYFKDHDTEIKYRIHQGKLEFLDNGTDTWRIDSDFGEDETYTEEIVEIIKNKEAEK